MDHWHRQSMIKVMLKKFIITYLLLASYEAIGYKPQPIGILHIFFNTFHMRLAEEIEAE